MVFVFSMEPIWLAVSASRYSAETEGFGDWLPDNQIFCLCKVVHLKKSCIMIRWLQKTEPNKPWAFFPIQVHHTVKSFFSVAIISEVGNGRNTLFWTDNWVNGQSLEKLVPNLYRAIAGRAKKRTVADALLERKWVADIRGALTVDVLAEYLAVWYLTYQMVLQLEVEDNHIWQFSTSGKYSAKSAYEAMFIGATQFRPWERIWKLGHRANINSSCG